MAGLQKKHQHHLKVTNAYFSCLGTRSEDLKENVRKGRVATRVERIA